MASAKRRRTPTGTCATAKKAARASRVAPVPPTGRVIETDGPVLAQAARRVVDTHDDDDPARHRRTAAAAARAQPQLLLPNPGRGARVAPALAAAAAPLPSSSQRGGPVLPDPPPPSARPPLPPRAVPDGLPPDTDYLELLLTSLDADLLRREVGWIVDEVQHRHPRFDTRMLRVLRDAVAVQPPDFALWRFMIIAYVFDLPFARDRIASATPWHRLEPILHHWRDEFFVFANARHSYYEAANEQSGKTRAYVDWIHYTMAMRFDYLCHYDQGGRWTATMPPRLPRPLQRVGVAADPRAAVRAPAAPPQSSAHPPQPARATHHAMVAMV